MGNGVQGRKFDPPPPFHYQSREIDCTSQFLNSLRKKNGFVEVYLVSGTCLVGTILEFDRVSIVFLGSTRGDKQERQILVLRSAITTVSEIPENENSK